MKEEKILSITAAGVLVDNTGSKIEIPMGWELLKPGDAGVTRKVKSLGPTWKVETKRGRRIFSQGIYAPKENIEKAEFLVAAQRQSPDYQKKQEKSKDYREKKQGEYSEEFLQAVTFFLNFAPVWQELETKLAKLICASIVEVGSGTVARTKRIPINNRAEAAVIAWFRHQTTSYDALPVPKVKGMRRAIRKKYATETRLLLDKYRSGREFDLAKCALQRALTKENDED
jgi:hypothetical protein